MSTPTSDGASTASLSDLRPACVFFTNDFPADEIGDLFRSLRKHSKDLRCTTLSSFLSLCNRAIRDEVALLPNSWQKHLPPTIDFLALVDDTDFRKGAFGGAMEGVYLCMFQISAIIAHHELETEIHEFGRSSTLLSGLGCGLLAATAVAVSRTVPDLAVSGAQVVRVAFRLGIHVYEISNLLETTHAEKDAESWAYVVPGVSTENIQAELDAYNKNSVGHPALTSRFWGNHASSSASELTYSQENPSISSIFISASDTTSVSISGPPSRLRACIKGTDVIRYSNFLPLPVHHGLCHAPHIYSKADVEHIKGEITGKDDPPKVLSSLLSSNTGRPFTERNFDGLLSQVLEEILTCKIHIDNIAQGIVHSLQCAPIKQCPLWSFRASIVLRAIITSLEKHPDPPQFERRDLVEWVTKDINTRVPSTPKDSKLAIVGMSCRMPGGANNPELFWKLMAEGADVHTTVPPDRFDIKTHYDPTRQIENSTLTPYMNPMENPGFFDAGFFNMSPREALETDPMHRLALVTAYEALEMAGYTPNRTPSSNTTRVGTYYGQASDDWRELNASQNIGTYAVPGGERGFANGRIQYFFKFSGPSFNIDTACSSGLAAVNAACSALWAGEVDTAIAGGLNVITNPDNFAQLGKGHFLSTTGQCKVWDASADGYCRADGVGSVVIKKLEDAEADNDNILAVILSAATNHSAEAASITQPHAPTQMRNYRNVMSSAGISPLDVSYVELHGTGTQVGDREESRSVAEVFAPLAPQKRRKSQRLRVASVKGNIGHGEAAAGIASLVKVLLMYQKGWIPPHIGVKVLNPTIPQDLEERNMCLNLELSPWPKPAKGPRYAIVNSFGAHGGNTTVLLEETPEKRLAGSDPRVAYPMTISARSRNSLRMNIEATLRYLDENPGVNLGDLSYTLCARRMHHTFRIAQVVDSEAKLRKFLTAQLPLAASSEPVPSKSPAVAFVFSGQGVFYGGIGQQLYAQYPAFRADIDRLDRLVQGLRFPSVLPCIDGSSFGAASPVLVQLCIVVIEIAMMRFWNSLGVYPSVVLGHSLGEYAAFVASGTLSEVDALFIAGSRAKMLSELCSEGSHKMLAVRAPVAELESLLTEDVDYEVSCINTENDTVISGTSEAMTNIASSLTSAGVKCTLLDIPFAFHSAHVDPVLDPLEKTAENVKFKAPSVPVISPLLAECIFDGKTLNAKYLRRATREPVDFVGALDAAQELDLVDADTVWIEIGPHIVTGTFVTATLGTDRVVPSLQRDTDNFTTIGASMSWLHSKGVEICWNEYYRPYEKAHHLLTLESYKWNEKNYWIPYLGTWTLDKANIKHNLDKAVNNGNEVSLSSKLKTSLIHGIVSETIGQSHASVTTISNMLDPAFLEAVEGHRMNGHGVATSSIWADMAFTVGTYLRDQVLPNPKTLAMNVTNMTILEGQVANLSANGGKQLLQLEANLDVGLRSMLVSLFNVLDDGTRSEKPYGTCCIIFEDPSAWQQEWGRMEHLVLGQIQMLEVMAHEGRANRLTRNMAYTLFANLVNYANRYRGMQSVIMNGYEACADITLSTDEGGISHTPPHWIDSVAHLAGLIMNGSDASNTDDYFYVTPGWESVRLAKPLEAGASYRSYVKMIPTGEKGTWAGDVYILQNDRIVGIVCQIKFKQYPRLLLSRFFSPNKGGQGTREKQQAVSAAPEPIELVTKPVQSTATATPSQREKDEVRPPVPVQAEKKEPETTVHENTMLTAVVDLIASEAGLDKSDFTDSTLFASIGVDSLMSLVLVEKFKTKLKLEIKSSLFLECPTIGEFKEWLEENR